MSYCDFFKDKKITVLGLGLLGRGVGDIRFMAECGAKLLVTDLKTEEQLAASLDQLKDFDIEFVLGEHRREDFRDCDFVLKAAGVPLDSPYIAEAKNHSVPVYMSAALLAHLSGAKTVGVTGTRGKSTVTHLIYHVLKEVGQDALLGGNVRGVANLPLLKEVTSETVLILELDSWQLQGFGEMKISPNISAFTSFMSDHLNYYPDMETYWADKAKIFEYQKEGDTLVFGEQVLAEHAERIPDEVHTRALVAKAADVPSEWTLTIPGEHNRMNVMCAVLALRALGLADEEIQKGVECFPGVPGRLQFLREVNGVKWYNDNNATTPAATSAALKALASNGNLILIVGGVNKNLPTEQLVADIKTHCKSVVMLNESGADEIKDELLGASDLTATVEENLEACVRKAHELATSGDTVVFSPAFASFGKFFKNEYDRNDQFVALVEKL